MAWLHAMVKIKGGLQQSSIGCATHSSDPLRMKVWVTWPGEEP